MKPRSQGTLLLWATILIAPSCLPAQVDPRVPPSTLPNAPAAAQLDADTQKQLAADQIESEKSQRLLGVFPNFFVVYDATTPPLTAGQKFRLSGRTLIDPGLFVTTGITAGIQQAAGQYSGFGSGAPGYFSRFSADYATSFTGILITGAALPSLFHQDPRYFYKGKGSIKSRLWYVTSRSVIQKGDNGKWQPAYSNVLGNLATGTISTAYYPSEDRNWATVPFENLGFSIGSTIINNFLQEFVFSHITTKKKPKH